MAETTGSATISIEASPEQVYAVLSDLGRISEISPECYKAEWERGATGPEVGAAFRGYNERAGHQWDVGCVVAAADPGKRWAFTVPSDDGRDTLWAYDIVATEAGCDVTESFDAPILVDEHFLKMGRHPMLLENIATSLANLKQAAES
jgi:hypothetical protein